MQHRLAEHYVYELIGMTEVNRFEAAGLVEPFMAFDEEGGRMGLLAFAEPEVIEKSPLPARRCSS